MVRSLEDLTPIEFWTAHRCLEFFCKESTDTNVLEVAEQLRLAALQYPQTVYDLRNAINVCGKNAYLSGMTIPNLIQCLSELTCHGWRGRAGGFVLLGLLPLMHPPINVEQAIKGMQIASASLHRGRQM